MVARCTESAIRKIAHISDVHFGTVIPAVAEAVVRELNERRPDLVVVSGDLTQRARAWQYKAAKEFLDRIEPPKLVVPGNHDVPLYDLISRFFAPLGNYTRYITKDLRPVFALEDLLVIGINTARSFSFTLDGFWKDGKISEEQLLDVKLRAGEQRPEVLKIVVTHHPFIPPPGERVHGIVHGAKRALAAFSEVGVDIVLAGHLHMGYSGDVRTHHEATKRSILSIQAGTATSDRLRGGEPNAYNWLEVDVRNARIEVRAWTGESFNTATVKHFARASGGVWEQKD